MPAILRLMGVSEHYQYCLFVNEVNSLNTAIATVMNMFST